MHIVMRITKSYDLHGFFHRTIKHTAQNKFLISTWVFSPDEKNHGDIMTLFESIVHKSKR
jgi:hypothetical protein